MSKKTMFISKISRAIGLTAICLSAIAAGTAHAANVTCIMIGASYDVEGTTTINGEYLAGLGAPLRVAGETLSVGGQPASIKWINRAGSGASSGIFTLDLQGNLIWDTLLNRDLLGFIGQTQRIFEQYGSNFDCGVIGLSAEFFSQSTWNDMDGRNWSNYQNTRGNRNFIASPSWSPIGKFATQDNYNLLASNVTIIANQLIANGKKVFFVLYPPAEKLTGTLGTAGFISDTQYRNQLAAYKQSLDTNNYIQWIDGGSPHSLNYIDLWSDMTVRSDHVHPDAKSVCKAGLTLTKAIFQTFRSNFPAGSSYTTSVDCNTPDSYKLDVSSNIDLHVFPTPFIDRSLQ